LYKIKGAVHKENFGQPLTTITLPKARKSSFNAVFGLLAGQKLHNFKDICAFGRAITVRGCPKKFLDIPFCFAFF
jgi:hypothetical protein